MLQAMTTYVLVHGAWSGGWKWRYVAPILRRAGHDVFTPTLTGLGSARTSRTPTSTSTRRSRNVVALIEMEDLREVVLLGHSYGGMVVTGVAERAPDASGAWCTSTPSSPRTAGARSSTSCPSAPPFQE